MWGKIRKIDRNLRKNEQSGILAHLGLWGWLRPCVSSFYMGFISLNFAGSYHSSQNICISRNCALKALNSTFRSSDWLCRSHIMHYYCGYYNLWSSCETTMPYLRTFKFQKEGQIRENVKKRETFLHFLYFTTNRFFKKEGHMVKSLSLFFASKWGTVPLKEGSWQVCNAPSQSYRSYRSNLQ